MLYNLHFKEILSLMYKRLSTRTFLSNLSFVYPAEASKVLKSSQIQDQGVRAPGQAGGYPQLAGRTSATVTGLCWTEPMRWKKAVCNLMGKCTLHFMPGKRQGRRGRGKS